MKSTERRVISVPVLMCILLATFLMGCKSTENLNPIQFEKQDDQRLIRINIRDYGAVTFRLFTKQEPEVVAEFIERAKSGYYDGTSFFEMIDDYLVMGGRDDLQAGKKIEAAVDDGLYPFKGALCTNLSNDGTCSLNSFYVITLNQDELTNIEELVEHKGYTLLDYIKFGYKTELTEQELDSFRDFGGAPWLYGHTVVFGQVIEGFEIFELMIEKDNEDESNEFFIDSIETD